MFKKISSFTEVEISRGWLNLGRIQAGLSKLDYTSNEIKKIKSQLEKRELELEAEHISLVLKENRRVRFKKCTECGKSKPADNSYFGFGFMHNGNVRAKCKSCKRKYNRDYSKFNPEVNRERTARNRQNRLGLDKVISDHGAAHLWVLQDGLCAYCGNLLDVSKGAAHLDHYVPIALGGDDNAQNLVWACKGCNLDKCSKAPADFHRWRLKCGLKIRQGGFFKPA